jgi:ribosomal protein L11 methyltransferase
VPAEHAEGVLAELVELAPEGFEQVDGDGFVEFALYGSAGELPELPRGRAELGGVSIEVTGTEVGEDWADRWREFHRPAHVGDIRVRAPWHDLRADGIDIVIDPGRAFGTGAHPTTRLCLELLLELPAGGALADLGCGSGVLAIAAALLGFGPVTAVDNELAAVEATRANAAANHVALAHIERVDLREQPPPPAQTVAANLTRPLLLDVAQRVAEPPTALILSGLLDEEAGEVVAAFRPLHERRRLSDRGWSAVLLL